MKLTFRILIFTFLTITTQIGGIIYFISILLVKNISHKKTLKLLSIFIILYLLATFLIVPYVAPKFGREKITETPALQAHAFFYKLANRNYVRPELNKAMQTIASDFSKKHTGIKMVYLDANFPFLNKFPLLPHLSHNDGKKVDVSFIYKNANGQLINNKPSNSGYGVYVEPEPKAHNQTALCKKQGFWQYDFTKYLSFGTAKKNMYFSAQATRTLANSIIKQQAVQKLFIEPHLQTQLGLTSKKIRFQGCQAVRHDDHIHFQIK